MMEDKKKVKKPFYKRWWFIGIVLIILFIALSGGGEDEETPDNDQASTDESDIEDLDEPSEDSSDNSESVEEPEEIEELEEKTSWVGPGMYKVGSEIEAGEYYLISDGISGYYQVTNDSSGELESIISNDNFNGNRYVTVEEGKYLEFKMSKAIPAEEAPKVEVVDGNYPAGMYKIGEDIPAGEYKVVSDGMAYLEVNTNSNGTFDSIVSNDNFEGEKYITVEEGQYLKINQGHIVVN